MAGYFSQADPRTVWGVRVLEGRCGGGKPDFEELLCAFEGGRGVEGEPVIECHRK